jgi:hypothetical protein
MLDGAFLMTEEKTNMKRKTAIAVAVLAVAASITSVALSSRNAPLPRLDGMSNPGTPVSTLAKSQLDDLARSGVNSDVRLFGKRAGISFYTATSNGQPCFLTSNVEAPRPEFSVVACLGPGSAALPSTSQPIVDFSATVRGPGDTAPHINWLAGFAADDVAAVAVVEVGGAMKTTPVTNNIYAARQITSKQITAVVALDKNKNVIYRAYF